MAGKEFYWKREPEALLRFIGQHGGDRKLRFFAVAWWRLWPDSSPASTLIDAAERLADDDVSPEAFAEVVKAIERSSLVPRLAALIEVCVSSNPCSCYMTGPEVSNGLLGGADSPTAREILVSRARCLLGPPGRVKRAACVTLAVLAFARDIYDARDFSSLGILADLLEQSGCRDTSILDHCRKPGEHIRGCWVVDLVLGKKCSPLRSSCRLE